jgi:alpha-galactosidase
MVEESAVNVRIAGATPAVRGWRDGHPFTWVASPLTGDKGHYHAQDDALGLNLELEVNEQHEGLVLRALLRNTGPTPIRIAELAPLAVDAAGSMTVGAGVDRWSIFRNGYQSWSGTGTLRAPDLDQDPLFDFLRVTQVDFRHRAPGQAGAFWSDGFTAIKNLRSGETLLCGFLDARHAFGLIAVDVAGSAFRSLRAFNDGDELELAPGATFASAPLWLSAGMDEHRLLRAYAAAVGRTMGARVRQNGPRGWCSWYYYFQNISEAHVLDNVEALRRLRAEVGCDYVMIDDGYQRAIGDWLESNDKFPHGMAWLAQHIRASGFDAGIWLAPFIARPESRLFLEHPGWFVRTDHGAARPALWNPTWGWKGLAYALDTTHPEVLHWLEELARTLAVAWGYGVLKLDFLFAAALPGVRYDSGATRAQALRRGLEAIRRGAGEDTFVIGCGCPQMSAIGVVDAMRIGPDVAPFWSNWLSRGPLRDRHGVSTKHALRNTLARSWMHRTWWLNDPDCLMVRDQRTRLTYAEVRTLATIIALTDGLFVMSDCMDRLSAERRGLLVRAQALAGGQAEVADLFARDMPELLISRRADHILVAVFNFQASPARKSVDVGTWAGGAETVTDVWSGARWPVRDGWVDFGELPAHGCAVVRLDVTAGLDGAAS